MSVGGSDPDTFMRGATAVSPLTVLVWEYVMLFNDELTYIWGTKPNFISGIYILARYAGLVAQIVNFHLMLGGPLAPSRYPIPRQTCRIWFGFLQSFALTLLIALDTLFIFQIYALYGKRILPAALTIVFVVTQACVGIVSGVHSVTFIPFSPECNFRQNKADKDFLSFTAVAVCTKLVIAISILLKSRFATRENSPVVTLVLRDGLWIVVLLTGVFIAPLPGAIKKGVVKPYFVFNWPITCLSLATCRVILNLRRLSYQLHLRRLDTNAPTTTGAVSLTVFSTEVRSDDGGQR